MDRRDFLARSAAFLSVIASVGSSHAQSPVTIDVQDFSDPQATSSRKPLKVLVLGGTDFVGPPVVQRFIDRGHQVTLFNRGQTNPYLFPEIEKLRGNRYPERGDGLSALHGERHWDVVVDTWRDNPIVVKESIETLKDRVNRYIYVSSIAVYGNTNYETVSPITEETPLPEVDHPDGIDEDIGYRRSKILADQAVLGLGEKGATLRAHGIYGYYMSEITDGQAYWPVRIDRGGDILCPGDGKDGFQFIDVLDLASFAVHCAERGHSGPFNVSDRLLFQDFLRKLQALASNASTLYWVSEARLAEEELRPYSQLPGWVPRSRGPGFHHISDERARKHGLLYRPFEATFRDVIAGLYARKGVDHEFGEPILSDERATAVLRKYGYLP